MKRAPVAELLAAVALIAGVGLGFHLFGKKVERRTLTAEQTKAWFNPPPDSPELPTFAELTLQKAKLESGKNNSVIAFFTNDGLEVLRVERGRVVRFVTTR